MMKSYQIQVTGRVQNVGFRYYTRKAAHEMGLSGHVKNRSDGSVYIEVEGEETSVERFILWCHQGPTWARVEQVEVQEQPLQGFQDFIVR